MLEGFVLGFGAGVLISYAIVKIVVWATMRQIEREGIEIQKLMDQLRQHRKNISVQARLEEHHGEFYLYRIDNGEFIAQGTTAQEITERTDQRIRDKTVVVTESDEATMARYRATKKDVPA